MSFWSNKFYGAVAGDRRNLVCFDFRDKTSMHRKQNIDLIPADTKLERTLRSLRKTKRAENSAMAEERQDQTEGQRTAARRPPITDAMEDF